MAFYASYACEKIRERGIRVADHDGSLRKMGYRGGKSRRKDAKKIYENHNKMWHWKKNIRRNQGRKCREYLF